jgi:hypothetical protein
MSNKRKVEHKILGEVLLSFNDEGRPEYDYGTLSNIFSKAIEFLYSKDLLSEAEKKAVYRQTMAFDVVFFSDSNIKIDRSIGFDPITKCAIIDTIEVNSDTQYYDIKNTIDSFLTVLCENIVIALGTSGFFEIQLDDPNFIRKSALRYATALKVEGRILEDLFYNDMVRYLTNEVSANTIKALKEIYLIELEENGENEYDSVDEIDDDDVISYFAYMYKDTALDCYYDEHASVMSPKEYIEDEISYYKDKLSSD